MQAKLVCKIIKVCISSTKYIFYKVRKQIMYETAKVKQKQGPF